MVSIMKAVLPSSGLGLKYSIKSDQVIIAGRPVAGNTIQDFFSFILKF